MPKRESARLIGMTLRRKSLFKASDCVSRNLIDELVESLVFIDSPFHDDFRIESFFLGPMRRNPSRPEWFNHVIYRSIRGRRSSEKLLASVVSHNQYIWDMYHFFWHAFIG